MSEKNARILLVEDEPDGQVVITTLLEHLEVPFDVASNVAEAEAYLFQSDQTYTVAILDLMLPDKDGRELLAEILAQSRTSDLPCIAITAYHNSKVREDTMKAGFSAYFPKPIDALSFMQHLKELL